MSGTASPVPAMSTARSSGVGICAGAGVPIITNPAPSSRVAERVIPIRILTRPYSESGVGDAANNNRHSAAAGTANVNYNRGKSCSPARSPRGSKRQSLLVTLDDGSTTQIQGLVTRLGTSENDNDDTRNANNAEAKNHGSMKQNGGNGVSIEEIGQETLKREIRNSNLNSNGGKGSPSADPVRMVPIRLHDGKVLQREPDETMEIKAEFTNYCHQRFDDANVDAASPQPTTKTSDKRKSASSPTPKESPGNGNNNNERLKERIVPIRLDTGENFVPTFTRLDDFEPPEWSAFSPKSKAKAKTAAAAAAKETIVPIRLVDEDDVKEMGGGGDKINGGKIHERGFAKKEGGKENKQQQQQQQQQQQSKSSERGRPGSEASPSPRTSLRTRTTKEEEKKTTKTTKTEEKKTQHTVRFNVDDDDGEEGSRRAKNKQQRSSSLDNRVPTDHKASVKVRERHRSSTAGNGGTEKSLHEIDRDINKIWRELQELESLPKTAEGSKAAAVTVTSSMATTATPTPRHYSASFAPQPSSSLNGCNSANPGTAQSGQQQARVYGGSGSNRSSPARTSGFNGLGQQQTTSSGVHHHQRHGSPVRGTTVVQAASYPRPATPVKVRAFTTATPISATAPAPSSSTITASATVHPRPLDDSPASTWNKSPPPLHPSTNSPPQPDAEAKNYFTPRRDLEPTRPGNIQPVVVTKVKTAPASSHPPPGQSFKSINVSSGPFGGGSARPPTSTEPASMSSQTTSTTTTATQSVRDKSGHENRSSGQSDSRFSSPPARVVQATQHEITRARADSLQMQQRQRQQQPNNRRASSSHEKKSDSSDEGKDDRDLGLAEASNSSAWRRASDGAAIGGGVGGVEGEKYSADKETQTERAKKNGKCSLQ